MRYAGVRPAKAPLELLLIGLTGKKASVRNCFPRAWLSHQRKMERDMRSVLLWAIGIPLPIIIILWLATGHA